MEKKRWKKGLRVLVVMKGQGAHLAVCYRDGGFRKAYYFINEDGTRTGTWIPWINYRVESAKEFSPTPMGHQHSNTGSNEQGEG